MVFNCRHNDTNVTSKDKPISLKRSLSHMDLVEQVQPAFTMYGQGISAGRPVSTQDMSRLRRSNTNLINGFYTVRMISPGQCHTYLCVSEARAV